MKKGILLSLLFCFIITTSWGQAPESFNYQAAIRDANGELLAEQLIKVRLNILQATVVVFSETHLVTTSVNGLINLKVGDGTNLEGSILTIAWETTNYFLEIGVDNTGGDTFTALGTSQLLSVPYALYANNVANKDDADADSINEIQDLNLTGNILTITDNAFATQIDLAPFQGVNTDEQDLSLSGTNLSISGGNTISLIPIQDGVDDADNNATNEIQNLTLDGDTLEISKGNTVVLPYDSSKWANNGAAIYYNNGKVGIGTSNPNSKLEVQADASFTASDTLFAVKDKDGNVVFAVYPDGAQVIVNEATKGNIGGFAVSGRSPTKAGHIDILTVTADSTRIYISDTTITKGGIGGFAVSGRSPTKAGYTNLLNITKYNYFIGHDIAPNITTGLSNLVLGYNAGYSLKTGSDNIFIGKEAGYKTGASSLGNDNVFIGNKAGYNSTSAVRGVFIGKEAGFSNTFKHYNVYIGDLAGTLGTGEHNTIIGAQAASNNDFGDGNVVIGYVAGRDMLSTNNVIIGKGAGYNNSGTDGGNVFIGYYAGETLSTENHRLAIANNRSAAPLIYGEFDNRRVAINGTTTNDYTFYVNGTASGEDPWGNVSDMRLKQNIKTIDAALDKVLKLRGVSFDWIDPEKEGRNIGFIAQEAKEIIPEVVNGTEETSYSMQYAPITAILVEAVKEQQTQIKDLKSENEELKARLKKIEEMLNKK